MKNLDNAGKVKAELQQSLQNAISEGDSKNISDALLALSNSIKDDILIEHNSMTAEMLNDRNALAARGVQPLTKEERKYYNEVIEGHGFENTEQLVPATVINRVFEELERERPLLSKIDFKNVGAITKWILKKGAIPTAYWGKLTGELKEILDDGFEVIQTDLFKLSAFIPVHKSMLDLGPEWLDKYVRTVLGESLAIALEDAIVAGTGVQQPIGMIRDMTNFNATDGYPKKTAIQLDDLTPATLGSKVMAPLTREGKRKVTNVLMVVNPVDYWEKIFPSTTMLTQNGAYVSGILPIPATFVQSASMEKGKMAAGIAEDYFMGVGSSRKIEYSDEYKFIEDQRVYATKQYANGKPKDNDSFILFDISDMATRII